MSEPVKIAFIGCGGIAGQHAKGYADLYKRGCRDLEYAACCDVNEANAKERAKEIAAIQGSEPKVFTDLKDLTESGVAEAADICSPHWLHHALAIQCLEGGSQGAFHDIPIRMVGHQRDFCAQRSRSTIEALETLWGNPWQADQAACSGCEKNETTAIH